MFIKLDKEQRDQFHLWYEETTVSMGQRLKEDPPRVLDALGLTPPTLRTGAGRLELAWPSQEVSDLPLALVNKLRCRPDYAKDFKANLGSRWVTATGTSRKQQLWGTGILAYAITCVLKLAYLLMKTGAEAKGQLSRALTPPLDRRPPSWR